MSRKSPEEGSKAGPLIPPKAVSTMLKLPKDTLAARAAVFFAKNSHRRDA